MSSRKSIAAIVVAAGRGERASSGGETTPKQYRLLAGVPVLSRTIDALLAHEGIGWVLPVIHPDHAGRYAALGLDHPRLLPPVMGGAERQASVLEGLKGLAPLSPNLVLIQDAARPFVDMPVIEGVIDALAQHDAALPVTPVTDTIKRSLDGRTVVATEDRQTLFAAQTPQGFRFPQIFSAHMRAARLPRPFTDDAAIAEWAGLTVALTPGSTSNIKITHPEDFARAERMILGETQQDREARMEIRTGLGIDFHQFEPGDAVWLGGVRVGQAEDVGTVVPFKADAVTQRRQGRAVEGLGLGDVRHAKRHVVEHVGSLSGCGVQDRTAKLYMHTVV